VKSILERSASSVEALDFNEVYPTRERLMRGFGRVEYGCWKPGIFARGAGAVDEGGGDAWWSGGMDQELLWRAADAAWQGIEFAAWQGIACATWQVVEFGFLVETP